jgi:Cof subfamily protein (haloacid dehalogenase superfamily)
VSDVRLVVSDVDGTLVTSDKTLTPASIAAVARLREAGIAFAVTSGRPPRGMDMLVGPLGLSTPIAGFNGGLMVDATMAVLAEHALPTALVPEVIATLDGLGLDVWCYRGTDWYVLDVDRPHVAIEAATVQFAPTVIERFDALGDGVVKVVGVSDDHAAVAAGTEAIRDRFGDGVSASPSQPYYLDVTHPQANKGCVVEYLADALDVAPTAIATIGDMPNDVLMFARSGLSIAMGNADREVQRAARRVTASHDDEGFARAIDRYVLTAG